MSMRGIDISNWKKGLDLGELDGVEFVICKATEGLGFVDRCCDPWMQWCFDHDMPCGFYHFARQNNPEDEAEYFHEHTKGYVSKAIPILDWESDQSVDWVNSFCRRYHDLTCVWPWIYANPWRFNQGGVNSDCDRWIASYPPWDEPSIDRDLPSPPSTDGLICAWQFASDGQVKGADGFDLDVSVYYGDRESWSKYAMGDRSNDDSGDVSSSDVDTETLIGDNYTVTVTRR